MMRLVLMSYLIALFSLISIGVKGQAINDGTTPGTGFTSLLEAQTVTTSGIYWFSFQGFAFSTYVDANGYVQVASDYGNGAGALPGVTLLDNTQRGILTPVILDLIPDAAIIRIAHSGGLLDVTTSNSTLITKLKNNQSLNTGEDDVSFNTEWKGVGANAMNRVSGSSACYDGAKLTLPENVFWPCGDAEGMRWQPSKSNQSLEFSAGEIGNIESFTLWVKAEEPKECNDNDNDGICDDIDLDDDNDGIWDADECPNTLVSKAFETSGGTTTTFLAPSADGGFRFDIFKLDNSFNLNVNGSDVVANQIQCYGGGAAGESLLVFSADNTGFGQGGNDNVWVINGDVNEPVVRLIIGPNGEVSFQGKRNSGRGLESMEVLGGDPQPVNVTWNTAGNNTVVLSQAVVGPTNISGEGNGVVLCVTDTDGDGILNSFDTDSDGDGCPDAVEGDAGFKLTDVNSDDFLDGAINANGVPLAANGGQNIGSSVDENVKSNECGCDDSDNDGVCDDVDLDDDNDGILDVEECMTSNFQWSTPPQVNGKTATGKINGVNYTYTSSINIETTPSIFAYNRFPTTYNIPNTTVIKNRFISNNTITFAQPILNPTLLFSSIGGGNSVPVRFSNQVEVLFQSGPVTIDSPTQLTAKEGYVILRMNGTFSEISFDYLANENYVNFTFGADFATFCDTDNDGTPDYLDTDSDNDGCLDAVEGDAGFKLTDVNGNDILAGAIDANGVPVAAAGGQGKGSSADAAIETFFCAACEVEKPTINGVNGQAFHSFYFDADQPLNETVNGLAAGERYKVKVTGTWSIWSSDPNKNVIDAAYRYKQKNASADIVPVAGIHWQINGASPSRPVPEGYNSEHIYFFGPIATGNGEVFFFSDNNYGDNGGGMNFEFYKILDTIRVCASNTNTLLTEYADGQDLKWYSSETSNDATTNVPNINNNIVGLTEYWVTQTIDGCESERIQILYLVKPLPVVELGADIDLCSGESVILNAGNHTSYLWNTTAITSDIEVATTGSYSVEVTDNEGCKATSAIEVIVASCIINYIKTDTLYVCDEDSILINANEVTTEFWGGDEGFTLVNDSTIKVSPTVDSYYFIGDKGGKKIGENLIVNGDFESGNTGFTTEYQEKCTPTQGPGKFCINNNPKNVHGAFSACGDHTSGTGNMYIANGAPVAGQKVWCQTVTTETNKEYEFSSWVASVVGQNPPNFEFRVNGISIGALTANVGSCQWGQYAAIWESGSTTSVEICLTNENTVGSGNDFAVDDISFAPIHYTASGGDSVLLIVYENPVVNLGSDTVICSGDEVFLETDLIGNYAWSTGSNRSSVTVNQSGDYSLEVINSNGCKGDTSINLTVKDLPIVALGNDTTICADSFITFNVKGGMSWTWSNGDKTQKTSGINSNGEYSVVVTDDIGCTSYDTVELFIQTLPLVNLGNDTIICDGESVILDSKNGGLNYSWNTSETTQEIAIETTGVYGVEVTDDIGCLGSDSMQLIVNLMPKVNLGNDTAICFGESVILHAQNPEFNYLWSSSDNQRSIKVSQTSIVSVEVFDEIGCSDEDEISVTVNQLPVVSLGNDTILCKYQSLVLDAENARLNFSWNTGDKSQTITVDKDALYRVDATDDIGCLGSDEIYVTKQILPDPYFEKDKTICEGAAITLEPDAGFESYDIYWLGNVASFEIEVTETGAYSSVIQSEFCKDTFVVNVAKIDTPDAVIIDLYGDGVYCFDLESTVLRIGGGEVNLSYDWTDFGRDEEVEIVAAGDYQVTASNDYCTSNYTHTIQEHCAGKLFVPNSFTPNNDGINDVFKPMSNGYVDDFDFRVYNRWGDLIFQTNRLDEGWDGRLRNNIVLIDVFVYKISYQHLSKKGGVEKEELVGTVTVLK